MEEMLKKFYKEYSERYAKYVDASETLDVALKYPELFDEASRLGGCPLRDTSQRFGSC